MEDTVTGLERNCNFQLCADIKITRTRVLWKVSQADFTGQCTSVGQRNQVTVEDCAEYTGQNTFNQLADRKLSQFYFLFN